MHAVLHIAESQTRRPFRPAPAATLEESRYYLLFAREMGYRNLEMVNGLLAEATLLINAEERLPLH